jgi:hypothetical protein
MQPDIYPSAAPNGLVSVQDSMLDRLIASARGWHSIQIAVVGFIGACGVFRDGSGDTAPSYFQWLSMALAVVALILAVSATYVVGRVAYPFYGGPPIADEAAAVAAGSAKLRAGVRTTVLAILLIGVASVPSWWPSKEAGGGDTASVQVLATSGERACGTVVSSAAGVLTLQTASRRVQVELANLISIEPVGSCA